MLSSHLCLRSVGSYALWPLCQTLPQVEDSLRSWRSALGVVGGHDTEAGNNNLNVCLVQERESLQVLSLEWGKKGSLSSVC